MKHFAAIEKATAQDASPSLKNARLLTVTIDPAYDTPARLREYGAKHATGDGPANSFSRWNLATGTADDVKKLAGFFGLDYYDGDRSHHPLAPDRHRRSGRPRRESLRGERMDGRRRDARTAGREAGRRAASVGMTRAPHAARCRVALLALLGVLMPAAAARADFLPSRPITFWNDRIVISGDATLTIGQADRGYFNSLDYYHDALNLARFGLSIEFKANDRIAVLGQVIDQTALRSGSSDPDAWSGETPPPLWDPFETNRHIVRPYALFVRVRPFLDKPITVQAGRIPPVFGAYVNQDIRRVAAAHQPAARLSLSDHAAARLGGSQQRGARALARRRLARPLPHRRGQLGPGRAARLRASAGTPACR